MPVSPSRAAAFDILLRVERTAAYASELLHSAKYDKLSATDHGLTTELVMGVLRWRSLLDAQIASVSSQPLQKLDPEVLAALRLTAYQIMFLDRIPARAAVYEGVELVKRARKRSAATFVNAVLRKLPDGERPPTILTSGKNIDSAQKLADVSAHPLWIVERWIEKFGLSTARQICTFDQQPHQPAIRPQPGIEQELQREGIALAPGHLLASARGITAGNVTQTQAFREGRVVIQDEASQLVALLVGKGSKILDCCAAPGGKTRILAEQNPAARVVAVESHPQRARLLQKRIIPATVAVVNSDVRELNLNQQFERVLADVPCSGTGTLSRHPEIKWRLQPQNLTDLYTLQSQILQSAMQHVLTGGELVYSTCSVEPEENEHVVERGLAGNPSFRLIDCRARLEQLRDAGELVWSDLDSLSKGPCLRTLPGVHPFDGFFAAVLQKA